MAGTTLGTAYVQIVPSAQGIKGSISNVLGGEAAAAGTSAGSKIGAFAKKAIIAAGIGTVVVKGVKDALAQGAALEQNIGGAYAVFGKQLYGTLEKEASQAYKNMGLSASDYYATANKMGSLFQGSGLSQQKSLDLTTKAMQRAADVASVMGIDTTMAMESIAGAAKGNFTMMDNLGVAMNATTLEAYALEKGLNFKWNTASNAEKAELAMKMFMDRTSQYAGNFARESDETFSGSLGAMKAAYQDFVGSLALGENVGQAMNNLITSASTFFFGNFLPMIGTLVQSLPGAIATFLQKGLPLLVANVTSLMQSLTTYISGLANQLTGTTVSQWVTANLPKIIAAGATLIGKLASTFIINLPKIVAAIGKIGLAIVTGLGSAIWGRITAAAQGIVSRFMAQIDTLKAKAKTAMENTKNAFLEPIADFKSRVSSAAQSIRDKFTAPIEKIKDKVKSVIDTVKNFFPVNLGQILHFSLPKITVSGGEAPWGIGGKGKAPSFGISWESHAAGGIFTRPTLLMGADGAVHQVGEAGAEAILPLSELWRKMEEMQSGANETNIVININGANKDPKAIAEEVKQMLIRETNQRRMAWQ